eukprot:TRINITY_DN93671_c0_g1_i1.p1 TRINITY_DN93671_c0_g1~~TRINITY_DN93671_c0_g1_i1.p1  ORF type:complete len:140 (-),score=21.14 TRINITY_DN93671_c0_g1_i1:158-538(-)
MATAPAQMKMDSIDESKVIVCDAFCCWYDGCLCHASACGCASKDTCCCVELDFCCKLATPRLCCGCCALRCKVPDTCIQQQSQLCCWVTACAFPCTSEVPCLVALCGLTCYPKCACCLKVTDAMQK